MPTPLLTAILIPTVATVISYLVARPRLLELRRKTGDNSFVTSLLSLDWEKVDERAPEAPTSDQAKSDEKRAKAA